MKTTPIKFTWSKSGYYDRPVCEFNLPAGHTCPFADACLTRADRATGRLDKSLTPKFKCYAAVSERFPTVRDVRWNNFEALRTMQLSEMVQRLSIALPRDAYLVRIHGGGDFFNQTYFDAWLQVVYDHPLRRFWTYTKSLRYWVNRIDSIPRNLVINASYGGKEDRLIEEYGLKYAKVFDTMQEIEESGLQLDIGDRLAMVHGSSFALLNNFSPDGMIARKRNEK